MEAGQGHARADGNEYDKPDLLDDVISTDLPRLIAEIEAALLEAGT